MCKWVKSGDNRIDPCMKILVSWLRNKHIPVACCCGHGRYHTTVVIKEGEPELLKNKIVFREIFSGRIIPRKRNFYRRDSFGYYFIPEVDKEKTSIPLQTKATGIFTEAL